jgi:O-acetylserine/cysteine efflux transporter
MSQGTRLPFKHFLLALAVVSIWGSNFVVIRLGLNALPPLLFATLRFTFAVLPAIFFLKKPDLPWRHLASYGLLIGVGQFGLLFLAMRSNISPGLASLVIQTQVFFTLMLSMRLNKEAVQGYQWLALLLAGSGIGLIATHTDGSATPLGLVMILAAAFSWACANMLGKRAGRVNMLAYMVWTSVFAVPPLLALSLLIEGPTAMAAGLARADATTWAAVLWQAVGNTLFGYAAWGWLLARHAPATVVPMALLVPVFGMSTAALVLGESLPAWKLIAAALVLSGLAINLLWPLRPWAARA